MGSDLDLAADREVARQLKRTWGPFFQRFGRLIEGQRKAIPSLLAGHDLLLCSPTASGKTEAACAPLVERHLGADARNLILYVSPTRALVNDLYHRLDRPLRECSVRLVRRTGDHRDTATTLPQVLLTTPESFDSLLCRGKSKTLGHLLAHTTAVVLDEIHLLVGTPRGEQVRWLLQRLARLRRYARQERWIAGDGIQVVGLSATLADATRVARDYLGPQPDILTLSGGREIETVEVGSSPSSVESALTAYLAAHEQPEKILVFCNTRRRVDTLTLSLRERLQPFTYEVRAHHGSLAKRLREQAEADMKKESRIVLVATSTLEIGIDIGDIDLVVLDGPPPDIASLLQRIGRGNRRTSHTRVMPCADSTADQIVLTAMIESARSGELGPMEWGPNYAVAVQQVASFIFQGPKRARSRNCVRSLLSECAPSLSPEELIDHLITTGEFVEGIDGLRCNDSWRDRAETGAIHSNIDAPLGTTIVDEMTGEQLAVGVNYRGGRGLQVGGQNLEARRWRDGNLEVRNTTESMVADGSWGYQSRGLLKGASQPDAVRRHLKLTKNEWPVLIEDTSIVVFHFGGASRCAVLELLRDLSEPGNGITVNEWFLCIPGHDIVKPSWIDHASEAALQIQLADQLEHLEQILRRPRANRSLPFDVRLTEVRGWLDVEWEVSRIHESAWKPVGEPVIREVLTTIRQSRFCR